MFDERRLSEEELKSVRDLGCASHLAAYVHLMIRTLGISPDPSNESVNLMVIDMIDPVNVAVEAAWRAMMQDRPGVIDAMRRQQTQLEKIIAKYENGNETSS